MFSGDFQLKENTERRQNFVLQQIQLCQCGQPGDQPQEEVRPSGQGGDVIYEPEIKDLVWVVL